MSFWQAIAIRRYYFNLYLWTQFNQQFRAFSGVDAHTIHRSLCDPDSGEFSPKTIHRLMGPHMAKLAPLEALDAGSGYGGACLDLHRRLGGRWHGITISGRQTRIARRNAAAMGVADAVTFEQASYDDPVPGRYNLVFAIESLIHSHRPRHTVANLAASLSSGGLFIIVDDMPAENLDPVHAPDLAAFKRDWHCPEMPTAETLTRYLADAGCTVEELSDFSSLMRPRAQSDLDAAAEDIRRRSWWRPFAGMGSVTGAELGGLVLEKLGREGAVRYRMIVARKR